IFALPGLEGSKLQSARGAIPARTPQRPASLTMRARVGKSKLTGRKDLFFYFPRLGHRRGATMVVALAAAITAAFWWTTPRISAAQNNGSISTANKIRASFLLNFPQFVDWPADAFKTNNSPFVIGLLGHDPFGHFLDELVAGEKVDAHPIIVRRLRGINEAEDCQLVYVSSGMASQYHSLFKLLKGRPVLTVGEAPTDFAAQGGMISFMKMGTKIRFRINLKSCEDAGLKISSKLLTLAEQVTGAKDH
ncbi:MAG TPA: YfiR family protein, partial [Verrucomicrobiae bacterium]|nr:YfiR family protein [Verrucomicrobiae bacterium]